MTQRPTLRQLIDQTLERVDGGATGGLDQRVRRLCEIASSVEPRQVWFTLPSGDEILWSLAESDPLSRSGRALLEAQPLDLEIRCHVRLRPPIMPGPLEFSPAVQSVIQLEVASGDLLQSAGLSMAEVGVQVWRVLGAASRLWVGGR